MCEAVYICGVPAILTSVHAETIPKEQKSYNGTVLLEPRLVPLMLSMDYSVGMLLTCVRRKGRSWTWPSDRSAMAPGSSVMAEFEKLAILLVPPGGMLSPPRCQGRPSRQPGPAPPARLHRVNLTLPTFCIPTRLAQNLPF